MPHSIDRNASSTTRQAWTTLKCSGCSSPPIPSSAATERIASTAKISAETKAVSQMPGWVRRSERDSR